MKIFICSLMLCCCPAVSAPAGDLAGTLWQRLIFCNQFAIEHPYRQVSGIRQVSGDRWIASDIGFMIAISTLSTATADAANSIRCKKA